MTTIGSRIRAARLYRNFTQEFMADRLEITQSTYSRIESGVIKPDIFKLKEIGQILEVELNYFVSDVKIKSYADFIQAF